ncbi:Juvenile hormone esterase [Anthophora plagiata]
MACENTVVRVKQGQIRGVVQENAYGGSYLAFRGIPYAKPPVGLLRFKDPVAPESWTGVRDASEFGSNAAQIDLISRKLIGSDDCLYLNVYRPIDEPRTKRSVMVWIHGGAFIHGSGDSNYYGPDYLIRKDIVLVTINYRLGVLGFMNLEHEIAPGNQGLKDQVMALKWVQENIASFGGDPDNVTIFGESAGAASVHYLTISPLAEGLFHKAIAQSGVATNPWALMNKDPSKYAYQLAAKLGEHSTDPKTVLEFLRKVDAQKLVATENQLLTPIQRHIMFGVFGPGVDDRSPNPFLPEHPSLLMQNGVKVPYLLGYNSNEGSFLLTPFQSDNPEEHLREINANFDLVIPIETKIYLEREGISPQDVKCLYFGNKRIGKETMQEYADYMSDVMFLQGIFDVVNVQLEKSTNPTYLYQFSFDEETLMKLFVNVPLPGATHADDLAYLFYPNVIKKLGLEVYEVGSTKYKVMEYLTEMWTNFAKTGNPTPKTTDLITTIWKPVVQSDVYNYLNINKTLVMECCEKEGQRFNWKGLKNKL